MSPTPSGTSQVSVEDLVFAVTSVSAATVAARTHGDLVTAALLSKYYELVANAAAPSGGRRNLSTIVRQSVFGFKELASRCGPRLRQRYWAERAWFRSTAC